MVTDKGAPLSGRARLIAELISSELDRQVQHGSSKVQVEALAAAIDAGLGEPHPVINTDEGRHPDELNSSNDD